MWKKKYALSCQILSHSVTLFQIYFGNGEYLGSVATVPLVPEGALKHDEYAPNYFNGPFMVMEGCVLRLVWSLMKRLSTELDNNAVLHIHSYMYRPAWVQLQVSSRCKYLK